MAPPSRDNVAERKVLAEGTEAARQAVIDAAFKNPAEHVVVNTFSRQQLERERDTLERSILQEKRELALADFWYFVTEVLWPDTWQHYYTEAFHGRICQAIQDAKPGDNLMYVLQREGRKSYLVLLAQCLWRICKDPNIRIMIVGAKLATSVKWASLVRNAFLEGTPGFAYFRKVFPEMVMERKGQLLQSQQFTHTRRTVELADPTVYATYIGVAGAGARADIQIFDDPYERRNVTNPQMSMKALQQTMDLFPLIEVSERARYRMRFFTATRWAYHDPTGVLIGERHDDVEVEDQLPPFRAMVRHAFEDPTRPCELCPKHVTDEHPHGHPDVQNGVSILDPIITRAGLEKRLQEYSADPSRGESLWWHQYQNVCLAPSDQKFKNEWLIKVPFPAWPLAKQRVLAIDSADKDFQQEGLGDYMVALMGEFDDFGRLLVINGLRSNKWTRKEFLDRIIAWGESARWRPDIVVKEKFGGDSGSFLTDVKSAYESKHHVARYVIANRPTTSTGNFMKKWDWIVMQLQGPMERAEVCFGSIFPPELFERTRYEMTSLGQVKHDDVADALSLFMVEGVRLVAPRKGLRPAAPMPPDLCLYDPGRPAPLMAAAPALLPSQQLIQRQGVQILLQELPEYQDERADLRVLVPRLDI